MSWWSNVKDAAAKVAEAAKKKLKAAKALAIATAKALADKAAAAAKAIADAAKRAAEIAARALIAKEAARTAMKKAAIKKAEELAKAAAKKVAAAARKVAEALRKRNEEAAEKKRQAELDAKAAEEKQAEIEAAITPDEVKKTWWEKILDTIGAVALFPFTVSSAIVDRIMFEVTGEHNTEDIWVQRGYDALNFLTPLDELSKLFFGENLAGDSEEFIASEDTLNLIVDSLAFIPITKIPGVALKLLPKIGGKGLLNVAGKAALKKASPEVIETLLKSGNFKHVLTAVRAEPELWAKFMPTLTKEAQGILFASMKKMADPTAFRLAADSVKAFETARGISILEKSLGVIPGATKGKKLFLVFSTLVGATAGYITLAQFLAWTGKEAIKEAISFSGIYLFIDNEEWQSAYDNLPALKTAIEAYEKAVSLTSIIPFINDIWNEAIKNAWIEYENYKTLIEAELAKLPEAVGTLIIRPDPTDAKVSVSGQIPTTGVFNKELEIGIYDYTVSKFGFVSSSDSIEITEDVILQIDVVLTEEIAPPVPPEEQKGNLIISVTPEDAKIEVSGQEEITTPGTYELFQGFYNIKVSKEGFETQITTSYVRAQEDTRASFVLKEIITPPEIAIIRIESDPIGATIFIDGQTTFNITNTSLQVEPGEHTLTIKKKEFIDKAIDFEIAEGESLSFNLTMEEIPKPPVPQQATITITSIPSDADIYINVKYTFTKTPYTVLLDAGDYYFRVQKEGYYPKEIIAEVEEGETAEIPISLDSIPVTDIPVEPYIPYQPTYPAGYETLYPAAAAPIFYSEPEPPTEKELLVNLETTDAKPWKGKIYSIAYQDLSVPGSSPQVLVGDNEEELLRLFIDTFEQLNIKRLVGFKLAFDHRFIFNKLMLYRIQSKKWADIELKDVKQLMDQVKEEFVYFPDKTGKLDDYGKELLGKGKYGSQANMLKQYLAKNFDYVRAFQERQLEITNGLYQLHRFSTLETTSAPISAVPEAVSIPATSLNPESINSTGQKQCANCLAFNPLDVQNCIVCGATQFK